VICLEGDPTLIIGDPVGGTFSGEGVIADEFDPALAGAVGSYVVTYTYTDLNGCTNSTTGSISVIQNSVDAGADQYIPEYTTTVVNAIGGATFLWEPPDGLSCADCPSPIFDSLLSQTYMVTSWDAYGCIDSDYVTINVVPVFDPVVFVPNTFTPNGDNINDYFFAYGTDLASIVSMQIYDRWGELIFVKENMLAGDQNSGWDGTYNGENVSQGVYAFMMIVQLEDGMKQHMQGNITLIR
jgi:gliding motility-associated-like protein